MNVCKILLKISSCKDEGDLYPRVTECYENKTPRDGKRYHEKCGEKYKSLGDGFKAIYNQSEFLLAFKTNVDNIEYLILKNNDDKDSSSNMIDVLFKTDRSNISSAINVVYSDIKKYLKAKDLSVTKSSDKEIIFYLNDDVHIVHPDVEIKAIYSDSIPFSKIEVVFYILMAMGVAVGLCMSIFSNEDQLKNVGLSIALSLGVPLIFNLVDKNLISKSVMIRNFVGWFRRDRTKEKADKAFEDNDENGLNDPDCGE